MKMEEAMARAKELIYNTATPKVEKTDKEADYCEVEISA